MLSDYRLQHKNQETETIVNTFQAFFLAIVQGLTEFLPVSSSGHLVLLQKFFNFSEPPVFFDILLHFGTLGSILVFFRKKIVNLIGNWRKELKFICLVFVGSLPAAFFGWLLNSKIEIIFDSLVTLGIAWIVFGLFLWSAKKLRLADKNYSKKMNFWDSLFIGFFQALALFPGISRSGSTIGAGLWRKFSYRDSFEFSFLLAIPAILGAIVFEAKSVNLPSIFTLTQFLSMLTAGGVGYLALVFLKKIFRPERFYLFGFYCFTLGLLTLLKAWVSFY